MRNVNLLFSSTVDARQWHLQFDLEIGTLGGIATGSAAKKTIEESASPIAEIKTEPTQEIFEIDPDK